MFVTDIQATYTAATDSVRRKLNQAIFDRVMIEEDGELTSDLARPFDILLSPGMRVAATERAQEPAQTPATASVGRTTPGTSRTARVATAVLGSDPFSLGVV